MDKNPVISDTYVANYGSDSVSVISGKNLTKLKDIPVGNKPNSIEVNYDTDTTYVSNYGSDSVSVISGKNLTKLKDIPVGNGPTDIAINQITNALYVANYNSDSVSIIDGMTYKIVAGVKFQVYPFYSGYIECNELISPISQYFYVYPGSECIAKPNNGFEFVSWEENMMDNSTQLITISHSSSTILDFVVDSIEYIGNFLEIWNILGIKKNR